MKPPSDRPAPLLQAFERHCIAVPISALNYLKPFREEYRKTKKYQQIRAAVQAIGLVEPPVIIADTTKDRRFLVLDGVTRIEVLKELDVKQVECLVALDDEGYTYNKRISRLSAVQDHRMIVQVVMRGVSPEKIAEALGLDVQTIRRRFRLLDGICDEVQRLLDDKPCPGSIFKILRQMTPLRQIEAAELMVGHKNFSMLFARALLAATPPECLIPKAAKRQVSTQFRETIARLERELSLLQVNLKMIEADLGENVLLLTITKGYLKKLLGNNRVVRWLAAKHPEYLQELQALVDMDALPGSG